MAIHSAARAAQAAQADEYGTYIAAYPIDVDGVRAFNPGNAVPASHVERGVVDISLVAKVGTKAAEAVNDGVVESLTISTEKG